jgi:hypothetical protein
MGQIEYEASNTYNGFVLSEDFLDKNNIFAIFTTQSTPDVASASCQCMNLNSFYQNFLDIALKNIVPLYSMQGFLSLFFFSWLWEC